MRAFFPVECTVLDAASVGRAAREHTARTGECAMSVAIVAGPGVWLGAHQHRAMVVDDSAAGVPVGRRDTSGTAAAVTGHAIAWTLSLPRIDALVRDATNATVFNRYARAFMRAFGAYGITARYFGREWITSRTAPLALLGMDATRDGATVLDVIVGLDGPVTMPPAWAARFEREVDRGHGRATAGWDAVATRSVSPAQIATEVIEACAQAWSQPVVWSASPARIELESIVASMDSDRWTPVPVACPIGWVTRDFDVEDRTLAHIGGDVLAPRWLLDDAVAGRELPIDPPLHGIAVAQLLEVSAAGG